MIGHMSVQSQLNPHNAVSRQIFRAVIVDYFQFLNHYQLSVDQNISVAGVPLSKSSSGLFGVRDYPMYPVGTEVLCYMDAQMNYAFILGAVQSEVGFPGYNVPNWIVPQSGVGMMHDHVHLEALDLAGNRQNFNNGRPYDALSGDYGYMNNLGMGFGVGLTTAYLKGSELVGVWLFQLQQKLRLGAFNYEEWTALRNLTEGNDEGENYRIDISSPYLWEMFGVGLSSVVPTETKITTEYDPAKGLDPEYKPHNLNGKFEPKYPDQVAIPRITELGGYLGDLERSIVSCPPQQIGSDNIERLSNTTNYHGLSEIHRSSNGLIEIRSRKGIVLERSAYIPVPKQIATPEDPKGDTLGDGPGSDSAYKFASTYGTGADHTITDFKPTANAARIAQLFDKFAWTRYTGGLQSLMRHKNDWHVSVEKDTEGFDSSIDTSVFQPYTSYRAKMPSYAAIKIDHRSTQNYYKSRSAISLNDDGSVVIEDGWGSQIVMERGNITITCAGDINLFNGRSVNVLAPKDINLRAKGCVDVSSGASDVRIKADKNLHMLGGNSSEGGVLIESKGAGFKSDFSKLGTDVQSSGIILKSNDSPTAIYGAQVYLRSTVDDIILDAQTGRSNIQMYALTQVNFISSLIYLYDSNPLTGSTASGVEVHNGSSVVFQQQVSISQDVQIGSSVNVLGSVAAASGVSSQGGGELGSILAGDVNRMQRSINTANKQAVNAENAYLANLKNSTNPYSSSDSLGQDSVIGSIQFSFRTDDQYKLDFVDASDDKTIFICEARWQQLFAINGASSTWTENPVSTTLGNTMPFPGHKNWTERELFGKVNLVYWSMADGETQDLTQYTESNNGQLTPKTLADGYITNS